MNDHYLPSHKHFKYLIEEDATKDFESIFNSAVTLDVTEENDDERIYKFTKNTIDTYVCYFDEISELKKDNIIKKLETKDNNLKEEFLKISAYNIHEAVNLLYNKNLINNQNDEVLEEFIKLTAKSTR